MPQDRNVNIVCLSSQEPVALSTFDACFDLLAVILCLLMLMLLRLLIAQHCDTLKGYLLLGYLFVIPLFCFIHFYDHAFVF